MERKRKTIQEAENEIGMLLVDFADLFLNGFEGYVMDEDHDGPYLFHMDPRSFILDSDHKVLTVYWEWSDEVFAEYSLDDRGKTWFFVGEEVPKKIDEETKTKLREMFNIEEVSEDDEEDDEYFQFEHTR